MNKYINPSPESQLTVTITEDEYATVCALFLAQNTQNMQLAYYLSDIFGLLGEALFNKEVLLQ